MRDADVWAPLTGNGGSDLYDSEEEEMGGFSAFSAGRNEEHTVVRSTPSKGSGVRGQVGKRTGAVVGGFKSAV